ncbi:hypothetical protein [Pseudooceanicola nanhaiensis]|uniref:hypothetical protein n=1 Tax=Pseudooceanicola nanhaiensis TaxID=375761 RepID=UPI0035194AC4
MEKSFMKCTPIRKAGLSAEDAEREWFARLLWRAFPEARSEAELAELVAEVLTTDRRPVHARTVRNWLRCVNAPSFRYTMQVIALAGAESLFELFDPGEAA